MIDVIIIGFLIFVIFYKVASIVIDLFNTGD